MLAQFFLRSTSLSIADTDAIRDSNVHMKRCPAELVGVLCLALAGCASKPSPDALPPEPVLSPPSDHAPSPEPDNEHLVPLGRPPRGEGSPAPPEGGPRE